MSIKILLTIGNKENLKIKVNSIEFTEGTISNELNFYNDFNQNLTFDAVGSVYTAPIIVLTRLGRIGKLIIITIPSISGTSVGGPTGSFLSSPINIAFTPTVDVTILGVGIVGGVGDTVLPYKIIIKTDGTIQIFHQLGSGNFNGGSVVGLESFTFSYLK